MGLDVKKLGETAANTLTGGIVGGALGLLGNLFGGGGPSKKELMKQA